MVLLRSAFGMPSQHALAQTNLLDRTLVIEYHNSVSTSYFLSTPTEAGSIIDAGGAGPGWQRTGETFYWRIRLHTIPTAGSSAGSTDR